MPVHVTVPVLGSLVEDSKQNSSQVDHQQETASLSDLDSSVENDGILRTIEDDSHKTTERQAFVHLLKGYVGPGCLSLPWAVSQLGIIQGCIAIAAVAYWSSYNCWIVVRLKLKLLEEQNHQHSNHANITYPGLARWLWGRPMELFLIACVCVQQLAVCTVFLSFMGVNLQAVLQSVISLPVGHVTVITVALPAVFALSCLPDLKALAPVIFSATVLLMVGLGLLLSIIAVEWENRPTYQATMNVANVPLAICAILYSFEGVCLILPVQSSMKKPQNFGPVFVAAMTASAVIFCLVAGLCVAAFGRVTSGSITAFLLEKYVHNNSGDENNEQLQSLLLLANAAVSFSVLITYPLQLFPCFELVGPLVASCRGRVMHRRHDHVQLTTTHCPSGDRTDFAALSGEEHGNHNGDQQREVTGTDYQEDDIQVSDHSEHSDDDEEVLSTGDTPLGRISLVLVTYVLAIAVPNVESMISLAGALAGSLVALLIPPAMQIAHSRQHGTNEGVVRSTLLFVAGFVFMIIGTVASILDIIEIYKKRGG